jgi:drug/metabolite transporter (DMT)-like permease
MKTSPHTAGVLPVLLGATMISFSPVFVKLAHVGPAAAGFYRMLFGGSILFFVGWIKGQHLSRSRSNFFLMVCCSIFFALDLTFWHRSIHYVGPGLATLLSNFQVFFLASYGLVVLRERFTWKLGVSIPLGMVGLYLIVGLNWETLPDAYQRGVLFGGIAALGYSAYLIALREVQKDLTSTSSIANLALISLLTAGLLGAETWLQGESFHIPDPVSWLALVSYGLVSQVLGWLLISRGMARMKAGQVGLVLLLQPTLAFVWDVLLFQRTTSLMEGIGALLALIAIYLGTLRQRDV